MKLTFQKSWPFISLKHSEATTRRLHIYGRYVMMSIIILIVAFLCVFALLRTTVAQADQWRKKGDLSLSGVTKDKPIRGDILASDGSILATNLHYYNVRIDFHAPRINELHYKQSLDSLADTLAVYYPIRTRDEWKAYLSKPLEKPKSERSRAFLLLKNIPEWEMERVKTFPYFRRSKKGTRTGFTKEKVMVRHYPYRDMARLSIGRVGQTKASSEIHGISGLEHALDTILYGRNGYYTKQQSTRGTMKKDSLAVVHGAHVTTTIDVTMQDILDHELGEMLVQCRGEWGSAMIMEVSTGDIKAISNLDRDTVGHNGYIEAMNHIVQAYEPGSVIKVISMLTALEDGYANLNQVFPIGHSYAYAKGNPIRDTHSPGSLPVSRFIEYSSNIGMTKLIATHYERNLNGFRERLREIGFFDRFYTGMARERTPYFPDLDPKAGGRVSLSRMIFGYATQVPPLYTCAIYNAIANNGKFVRPRLVKKFTFPDGRDSVIDVSYVRDSICTQKNARILRQMMHDVVWGEGGTAKVLRNSTVEIAGKTGTAGIALERPRDKDGKLILTHIPFKGGYREGKHNRVTFCGFFPYDKPKYTMIVVISDPQGPYGPAPTSGTVMQNVALKLYARGMLGNTSEYTEEQVASTIPTLYGTTRSDRMSTLHNDLQMTRTAMIRTADAPIEKNTVPNVTGLGVREALVKIEEAGLSLQFTGTGYVTAIEPPAGTRLAPGSKVKVTLSQN